MEENRDDLDKEVVRYKLKKQPLRSEREEIKEKKVKRLYSIIIIIVVLVIGFEGGLLFGTYKNSQLSPSSTMNTDKFNEIAYYFENYWLYADDYENLASVLYDKALYGMATFSDDPFTTYASASEMKEYNNELNIEFVGIGVSYRVAGSGFVISQVYEGSPAKMAGLEEGDIIMEVNGQSCKEMETTKLQEIVLGEENTTINFRLLRDGKEIEIDVTRGNVDSSVYAYNIDDVVILELYSFGLNTYDDCVAYLDEYKNYSKLVIDLRGNGGGYAQAVEQIAGLFLPEGSVVMREYDKNNNEIISLVNSDVYYDNFKDIIILTDANTASASEVLTLALIENHENAISLGTTTYGKGVVQSLLTLSDGSTLKLTSMYWTSDSGKSINEEGIVPDEEVLLDDVYYEVFYPILDDEFAVDSVSEYVRLTQEAMRFIGYDIDRVDGYFDESLYDAIVSFESDYGLEVDGILDSETYDSIISVMYKKAYMDIEADSQIQRAIERLNNE